MAQQLICILLQTTRVQIPVPTSGSSQLSVSPAPGDPMPSSSLWGDLHWSVHIPTQMQSHTYEFKKIKKSKWISWVEIQCYSYVKNQKNFNNALPQQNRDERLFISVNNCGKIGTALRYNEGRQQCCPHPQLLSLNIKVTLCLHVFPVLHMTLFCISFPIPSFPYPVTGSIGTALSRADRNEQVWNLTTQTPELQPEHKAYQWRSTSSSGPTLIHATAIATCPCHN